MQKHILHVVWLFTLSINIFLTFKQKPHWKRLPPFFQIDTLEICVTDLFETHFVQNLLTFLWKKDISGSPCSYHTFIFCFRGLHIWTVLCRGFFLCVIDLKKGETLIANSQGHPQKYGRTLSQLQFSRILKTRDCVMEGDVINENNSSTTPSSILLKWQLMSLLVGGAAAHKWLRWSFTVCVSHLTAKPPTFTKWMNSTDSYAICLFFFIIANEDGKFYCMYTSKTGLVFFPPAIVVVYTNLVFHHLFNK